MNTADRSIGRIDYAVRRRFAFLPLNPDREVIRGQDKVDEADKRWAADLFESVGKLFRPSADGGSGFLAQEFHPDDVQVGHTYFLGSRSAVNIKFAYQVYPLLREYYKDGIFLVQDEINCLLPGDVALNLGKPEDPNEVLKNWSNLGRLAAETACEHAAGWRGAQSAGARRSRHPEAARSTRKQKKSREGA